MEQITKYGTAFKHLLSEVYDFFLLHSIGLMIITLKLKA